MTGRPSDLNLLHVRVLRAVVDHGSLSGAAKELGYTTSAISQQISALEKALGVSLFERGPRSVTVTAAGTRMCELGADLLGDLASIADTMRAFSVADLGALRCTAVGSAAAQLLPRAVANMVASHPDAAVSLVVPGIDDDIAQSVRTGEADLGVVYDYTGLSQQPLDGLVVTPLLSEEMVVLGQAQGASGMRESIREFADESWVCGSQGSVQDELLTRLGEHAGFVPRIVHRSDDLDVIRGFVGQGLGIALVPILALGIDRTIRLYRLHDVPALRRVHLIHRVTDDNPLLAAALAAFHRAAHDFLTWTLTAFEVTFDDPMLTVVEIEHS
ncbi:LysR family transcriptional regulator [Brevibacterium ammoniilyticum]|uniref:LysR family transcriptional regulator n=1 Tax=Brevibacterium ammoniilyticum TaxID=1046555 RepID=A0ABP9TZD3_9MICO